MQIESVLRLFDSSVSENSIFWLEGVYMILRMSGSKKAVTVPDSEPMLTVIVHPFQIISRLTFLDALF